MSERELRGVVAAIVLMGKDFVATRSSLAILDKALAAEPDVVVLARKYRDATPWHPWHAEIRREIEEVFGFRLTDDGGWEWTDGGEDAE